MLSHQALDMASARVLYRENTFARLVLASHEPNTSVLMAMATLDLPHRHVAAAVETVRASDAADAVKLAFEFLVLTAARWGEVRWARWAEMDTTEHVWTIPATRMKANREHRVPLCRRAVEMLDAARTLGEGGGRLVFTVGGGGDGAPARGHRGGAGARHRQQGRSGLREIGPVRAAAAADGRLGEARCRHPQHRPIVEPAEHELAGTAALDHD